VFKECQKIDNLLGFEWYNNNPHHSGRGCQLLFYSPSIDCEGNFYPCIGRTEIVGNLRNDTLVELWNHPIMFKYKNIDICLQGECTKCNQFIKKQCYSCVRENLNHNNDPFISYSKCGENNERM
jgi:MoaA/NifB/PqqE/SkfB family radical SAM enzyme